MGFGGGGTGSFVLPDHEHSSVAEDGGVLDPAVTEVLTQTLEQYSGKMKLLDSHIATIAESSYTYTPAVALDLENDYSAILVFITGKPTAALNLEMIYNAKVVDYNQIGTQYNFGAGTTSVSKLSSQTQYRVGALGAAYNFAAVVTIMHPSPDATGYPHFHSIFQDTNTPAPIEYFGVQHTLQTHEMSSLKFETSTSTWKINTAFAIYGVEK